MLTTNDRADRGHESTRFCIYAGFQNGEKMTMSKALCVTEAADVYRVNVNPHLPTPAGPVLVGQIVRGMFDDLVRWGWLELAGYNAVGSEVYQAATTC